MKILPRILLAVALAVLASSARAANQYWTNSAGGNYTNPLNWNATAPAIADAALFTNASVVYGVTVGSSVTNANATFNGNGATVVLDASGNTLWVTNILTVSAGAAGNDSTLVLAGGTLNVTNISSGASMTLIGGSARGTLVVSNGSFNSSSVVVGQNAGSQGTLNLFGGTNTLTASGYHIILGSVANSTGNILMAGSSYQGAVVYATNADLRIGSSGVGVFTASNGTWFGNVATLGVNAGGQGTMNLFGGSNLFKGNLLVGGNGGSGTGTVLMAGNAPVLSVAGATLGLSANSLGTMTISNGTFLSSAAVTLGNAAGARGIVNIASGGKVISTAGVTLGSTAGSFSNSVLVTGSGSVWSNTSGLFMVGNSGGSNTLTIANSGMVYSAGGTYVGNLGNNNSTLVTDTGSVFQLTAALNFSARGNSLMVANGGTMIATTNSIGGVSNTMVVAGPGSSYTAGGYIYVGSVATDVGNALYVTNGGRATFTQYLLYGTNNLICIWGGGALVSNLAAANLYVGASAAAFNNRVRILDGATNVVTGSSPILVGGGTGATNNLLELAGTGSLLVAGNAIQVGFGSSSIANGFYVTNGGRAQSSGGSVGQGTGSSNNWALVSGQGSVWSNSGALTVGTLANSFGNNLTIANSGTVVNTSGTIGSAAGANSNSVLVAGSGSTWTNTGTLYVGDSGSFNQLTVTNGSTVFSSGTSGIGYTSGNSNSVLVSGSGSLWTNNGFVYIGRGGSFNSLTISNGGTVVNGESQIGWSGPRSNIVTVTGSGSSWTNTGKITVGLDTTFGNQLMVADGGTVVSVGTSQIGANASSRSNLVTVIGSGSLWTNNGVITVGGSGSFNQFLITNGGKVFSAGGVAAAIGNSGGTGNVATVTGSGSLWNMNNYFGVGAGGSAFSQLMIANSGTVVSAGTMSVGGINGSVAFVTDAGSLASVVGLAVDGIGSQLIITNGGTVANAGTGAAVIGGAGANAGNTGNVVRVTGTGSALSNSVGLLTIGQSSSFNQLLISGGGRVVGTNAVLGNLSVTGNVATVTGSGSLWTNTGSITVGQNGLSNALFVSSGARVFASSLTVGAAAGSNRVEITSGGLLEANSLVAGTFGGNSISNDGGVYQFSAAAPTITPGVFGRISLNNGTISFRGVSGAAVAGQITNIAYSGANTLRLDAATNAALSYVISNGSTFSTLELINNGSLWQGPSLLVGNGGLLRASNASATVGAVLTNAGTVSVINGQLTYLSNVVLNGGLFLTQNGTNRFNGGLGMASGATLTFTTGTSRVEGAISNSGTINAVNANVTFGGPVVISGLYASDPSTNTFTTNVTVTASGALSGSNGDLFVFQKDFFMQSTNREKFSLSQAAVLFSNGPNHLLSISNSGALELGHFTNFAMVSSNFSIGTLGIAPGDRVTLAGNKGGGLTNALYVGVLDIQGVFNTNNYAEVTNALVLALNLPNINLYYDVYNTKNDWLTMWLPPVTGAGYDLWNGGLLLPIPEPSPFLAVGAGLTLLAFLRRRRA